MQTHYFGFWVFTDFRNILLCFIFRGFSANTNNAESWLCTPERGAVNLGILFKWFILPNLARNCVRMSAVAPLPETVSDQGDYRRREIRSTERVLLESTSPTPVRHFFFCVCVCSEPLKEPLFWYLNNALCWWWSLFLCFGMRFVVCGNPERHLDRR